VANQCLWNNWVSINTRKYSSQDQEILDSTKEHYPLWHKEHKNRPIWLYA